MNPKNTKKSPIHEKAYANITCNFRDSDLSRLGVAYLTHAIHTRYIASWIIVRFSESSLFLTIDARSAIQDSNMIHYSCPGFSLRVIVWDIGCGGKIAGLPGHVK